MKQVVRVFVCILLTVVFSLCVSAQTLVFHLAGGAKSTVSLPATFTVTPTGDKLVVDGGGSVFLPAAGEVWYGELHNVGSWGYIWSSTPCDEYHGYRLFFYSVSAGWYDTDNRDNGLTVRPVR